MRKLALAVVLLASCSEAKPPPSLETLSTPEGHPRSKVIARGQSYLPADFLVQGYVIVLQFTLEGEKTCAQAAPLVDRLVVRNDRVLMRKVELGDGKSPAAQQVAVEHRYKQIPLPFFCIYDKSGVLVGKVEGPDLGALDWGIRKALLN